MGNTSFTQNTEVAAQNQLKDILVSSLSKNVLGKNYKVTCPIVNKTIPLNHSALDKDLHLGTSGHPRGETVGVKSNGSAQTLHQIKLKTKENRLN